MAQYTLQAAQANLSTILDQMAAGTITSVDLIKKNGGSTVAKLVKYSTYSAAAIAGSADLTNVPFTLMASGPMNPSSNGLYKMTKVVDDSSSIVDGTIHGELTYTGQGVSGVKFVAKLGGAQGNSITIAVVDPAAINQALSVGVVGSAITINLATDGSGNITSTFTQIASAVNLSAPASALVTASVVGTGSLTPESVAATLQVTQGAGGILYTAVTPGTAGNSITIRYVVAGLNTALSVGVVGSAITVNLATDGAGVATSTAAQVRAAVAGDVAAAALVNSAVTGVGGTLAAALAVTNLAGGTDDGTLVATPLAGGANQPASVAKFQAFGIFRKRDHSKNVNIAPSVTPSAVIISAAHATLIGL